MAGTVVQFKAGAQNTGDASVDVAFDVAPAAGNVVVLMVGSDDYKTAEATDNGVSMTLSNECAQETFMGSYLWWRVSSGGNAFQYNIGSAATSCWILLEIDGLEASPYDGSEGQFQQASSESYTTPNLTPTAGDRFLLAFMGYTRSANFTLLGTWLNSFTEIVDISTTLGSGTRDQIGVAQRAVTANGSTAYSSGATSDGSGVATSRTGIIIAFKVAAAGLTGNLTQVSVAASARTLTATKAATLSRVTVAASARTVVATRASAIARVTVTSSARAATTTKAAGLARVSVTATPRAVTAQKSYALGRVTVQATAGTVTEQGALVGNLSRVTVVETARSLTAVKTPPALGRVTVAATARSVTAAKLSQPLGRVTVGAAARTLTHIKVAPALARVSVAASARVLAVPTKAKTLGTVTTTALARSISAHKLAVLTRVLVGATARTVSSGSGTAPAAEVWGVDMGLV